MNNFNLNNNLYNRIRNLFISLSLNKNFIGKIDTKTKREFVQNYFDKVKKFCESKFKVDLSKYELLPFDEYDKYDKYFKEKLGRPLARNIACAFPLKSSAYINKYPVELKGKIVLDPHYEYTSGIHNIPTIICHELGHSVYAELYGSSYTLHDKKFQDIIGSIYEGMRTEKELGNYYDIFYGSKTIKLTKKMIDDYIEYIDRECIKSVIHKSTNKTQASIILVPKSRIKLLKGDDYNRSVITNYLVYKMISDKKTKLSRKIFGCNYMVITPYYICKVSNVDKFKSGLYDLVGKEIPVLSLN